MTVNRNEPPILELDDLRVSFHTDDGVVRAVNGVSWSVRAGETLGIVGESGSGKSVSALAVMGLLQMPPARCEGGRILYRGDDLLKLDAKALRQVRSRKIAMIFQDPLSALNPVYKVGHQIAEVLQVHTKMGRLPARRRAIDLLEEVGIPNARERADAYPHQFSGGMRQRVMIAMALALDPDVLIADEPTTALDVTVQAQIMEVLMLLQKERGTAIVLITHDLGLVASHADRVVVMYAGRVAEEASVDTIFTRPRHGYTHGLLTSIPRIERRTDRRLTPIPGAPPSLIYIPAGCPFHPRCKFRVEACSMDVPPLEPQPEFDHVAACIRAEQVAAAADELAG